MIYIADRYWNPAGAANWADANVWALTDGGDPTGIATPTSSDDVYFTSTNVNNCTIGATADCLSLSFTGGTGYTGILAGSSALNIYGSLTLNSGMTRNYTGAITFKATATGKTVTLNTKTLASAIVFDGVGGGWTLQDTFNNGSSNITLTNGTLDTNGVAVTCGIFASSNSNTRTLTLGASTITSSASSGWNLATITNLTFNVNTSTVVISGAGNHSLGGLTYNIVNFTSTGSIAVGIYGTNTFATLSITSTTGYQLYEFNANQTVTGSLTITGNNNGTNRIKIYSTTMGTQRTITDNGTISLTNVDFQDIVGAGSATWTGTSIGDCGNTSNITTTTPVNRYWIHGASASYNYFADQWSASSGGATGATPPLPQDTAYFDANSFPGAGKTVALAGVNSLRVGALNFTGATNNPTLNVSGSNVEFYGSVTLIAAMTFTHTGTALFMGDQSITFTSAGLSAGSGQWVQDMVGGTLTLSDDFSMTAAFTHRWGTLNANNNNFTSTTFSSTSTSGGTRVLTMGSGTWTLTGNNATVLNLVTASLTLNKDTSTVDCTYSGATGTRTLSMASKVINNLKISAGTDIVSFTSVSCANLDFTGFAGQWNGTTALNISGALTIAAGLTRNFTGAVTFSATSGTKLITSNAIALGSAVTFNGVGGTWQLVDAFNIGSSTITLTNGTFDSNGQAVTAGAFSSSNSNIRVLTMGASAWTISGTGTAWNTATTTNMTLNGNTSTVEFTNASVTVSSGGLSGFSNVTYNVSGGTLTLSSNIVGTGTLTLTQGTINTANNNVQFGLFTSSNANTRTISMGSGTWTLTGTGTVWNLATITNLTLTESTSTIIINDASATGKTFAGGGETYATLTVSGDNVIISGNNTFTTLNVNTAGLTNGLKITSTSTQTVTNFATNGSAGNLAKLLSTIGGSAHNLSKASGTVNVDYMSIQDSAAAGGATWYAGANSTNVSGNSGWIFTGAPGTTGGAFFFIFN